MSNLAIKYPMMGSPWTLSESEPKKSLLLRAAALCFN